MIDIEIVEGCNFKCYFCRAKELQKHTYINKALFERVIIEAKDLGVRAVKLTPCRGEPFIHPHIYELLDFACTHMKQVHMFTNATAINVTKLQSINHSTLDLHVSYYGDNPAKFIELTCTNEHMFNMFHRKLLDLSQAGVHFQVHRRDVDYVFDYDGGPTVDVPEFDVSKKCPFHQNPKIMANGDITYCNLAREEMPNNPEIFFANVSNIPLKEALEHPMRYKFFDSQSICAARCTSFNRPCHSKHSVNSMKLLLASKKNYINAKDETDGMYLELERALGVTNENSN